MNADGLLVLVVVVLLVVLIGMPAVLGAWSKPGSTWGAIALSTLVSPFLMLGAAALLVVLNRAVPHEHVSRGCPGGECGGAGYAAGYADALWPLLIPVFMVPSFLVSTLIILLIRSARK